MTESEPVFSNRPRPRLTIVHLLYATAVFASALSLMGGWGALVGLAVCLFWYYVFLATEKTRRARFLEGALVLILLTCVGCCLLPQVSTARQAARRMQCANNMKQLALAMLNYEADYKTLPPVVTYADDGTPMHSWRVLLLPYLEQKALYQRYRLDEPWNGPNNSKLLAEMPWVYRCPEVGSRSRQAQTKWETDYCVVRDPETCFPEDGARTLREIPDGVSNTVLLVEFTGEGIPWMAPVDPSLEDYLEHYRSWGPANPPRHSYETRFERVFTGEYVSLVDGSMHFLGYGMPPEAVRQMLRVNDGVFDWEAWESSGAYRQIRWDGYISLGALLLLSILPVFWLRRAA